MTMGDEDIPGSPEAARGAVVQDARPGSTVHTILFLAANPSGTQQLALGQELEAIRVQILGSDHRDRFKLEPRFGTPPIAVLRELRVCKPTIVHFSGHGGRSANGFPAWRDVVDDASASKDEQQHGLYLEGEDQCPQFVPAKVLAKAFESAGSSVRLVVLNACFSNELASALLKHVDCVIGIAGSVRDDVALQFASDFYGALAHGNSVYKAWQQGRAAIHLTQRPGPEQPQLAVRDNVDAARIRFAADFDPVRVATGSTTVTPIRRPVAAASTSVVRASTAGPPTWWSRFAESVRDVLSGGRRRRLRRATSGFERSIAAGPRPDDVRLYGDLLRLAVRIDVSAAVQIVSRHDARIPSELYRLAFANGESWLRALAQTGDAVQQVVFTIAGRLELRDVQRAAAERVALMCARSTDRDPLLRHLEYCRTLDVLDRELLDTSLRVLCQRHSLADAPGWVRFLATQPSDDLPEIFAVHLALGHGKRAAALAESSDQRRAALVCCLASNIYEMALPAVDLAQALRDEAATRSAHEICGDLALATIGPRAALDHYCSAGCIPKQSLCHERLGEYPEALETCADKDTDRLVHLANACELAIVEPTRDRARGEALRRARDLVARLGRAVRSNAELQPRLERAERVAGSVLASARAEYAELIERSPAEASRQRLLEWCEFEKSAGELGAAAELAERAGDLLQASILWERDLRYGEAVRVLGPRAALPEVRARVAHLREEAGDHLGAARLYHHLGDLDGAVRAFTAGGAWAPAAQALREKLGVDRAILSDEYHRLATRAGASEVLAHTFLDVLQRRGDDREVTSRLAAFLTGESARDLGEDLRARLAGCVGDVEARRRPRLIAALPDILRQASADVGRRYARIWGLDLGTTKCVVAVYDGTLRAPVICDCDGRAQFSSTVAFDATGREFVGLTAEELVRPGLRGAIVASKRQMGSDRRFRIGERQFRPEEVAARLISHGRGIMERFIRDRIAARALEIARAEFGEILAAWIDDAAAAHLSSISCPDVVVTIPAHFGFKQKKATRDACEIAGVKLARLVHEPTAACMAAHSAAGPEERVAVVDLGAGTLDLSVVVLGERVHEVEAVFGDNEFGGNDIDRSIATLLARQVEREHGILVREPGLPWRRLLLAAEQLKIALSRTDVATCVIPGFLDRDLDVTLALTAGELRAVIDELLGPLNAVCQECRDHFGAQALRGFLPVGGQMLSPVIREGVAKTLGLTAMRVDDPRTLVARGASLQAAILDGMLKDTLLLDVVPFSLGVKVKPHDGAPAASGTFSRVIVRHTTIPTRRSETYTTAIDNQAVVQIGVYQGEKPNAEDNVKMGEFFLEGILPAPKGTPKIEVTFDIDASGLLNVSALDEGTRKENSIRIEDTTMLSPQERGDLTRRFAVDRALAIKRDRLASAFEAVRHSSQELSADQLIETQGLWQRQLAAYEAGPSDYLPNAEDGAVLVEMFRQRSETEAAAALVIERVKRLQHEASSPGGTVSGPLSEGEIQTAQARAETLIACLQDADRELASLLTRVVRWSTTLGRLSQAVRDPLRRFVACHAAGNHAEAVVAFQELRRSTGDQHPKALWETALACLAAMNDRTQYRAWLGDCSSILLVEPTSADRLGRFRRRVDDCIARIETSEGPASGFLVSERVVATAHASIARSRDVVVVIAGIRLSAAGLFTHERYGSGLALIHLPRPIEVAPLRLGFSQFLEVGEPVAVIAAPSGTQPRTRPDDLLVDRGIVNRFQGTDRRSRRFEFSIRARPSVTGGPVFNDMGEVIGVIGSSTAAPIAGGHSGTTSFAEAINASLLRDMVIEANLAGGPARE